MKDLKKKIHCTKSKNSGFGGENCSSREKDPKSNCIYTKLTAYISIYDFDIICLSETYLMSATDIKGVLSGLKHFLVIERPLKIIKMLFISL